MASHSPHDWEYSRRYLREEPVDDRDPRYFNSRGELIVPVASHQLVPRGDPRDSSISVEEVRRDFPPPSGRDVVDYRRARSAEPGYYEADYEYRRTYGSRHDRDSDRHSRRRGGSSSHYGDDDRDRKHKHQSKSISKQEKIIAAVAGAALLAGGKELYDRHEAKEGRTEVQRNALSSVALAGFGALAAYQGAEFYSKQQAKKDKKANYILHGGRDGQVSDYYSSDDESDTKEKKGHKNFLESAIAATGLGAAVKSLTGAGDDKRSDARSRGGSPSSRSVRSRSGSRSRGGANKMQKAAMASLLAGATEAFRVAKEPGGWRGEKTKRILTAAAGAATVDAAHGADHGKLGLAESVIGGLVGNRLINGSKNEIEEDRATGRSRSRSRARSSGSGRGGGATGLAALATAGLGALGAKKVFDRSRSRDRGRSQSYDSRSPSRDRRRSRSRSIVDKARGSLAKLGIGSGAVVAADEHRRRDHDDYDDHVYDDDRNFGRSRDYEEDRAYRGNKGRDYDNEPSGDRSRDRRRGSSRSGRSSSSDLGDSEEDEKRAKKMRGKQLLTTGLAAVATVHAVHGVYKSMEKRKARKEAVKEGLLSPQEAKKLKSKALLQDAASVGIAGIGIKSAFGELKEARDLSQECNHWKEEKENRHKRRLERRKMLGDRKRSSSWSASHRSQHDDGHDADSEDDPPYANDRYYGAPRMSDRRYRRDSH